MEKDPYYQNIFVVFGLSVCLAGGATTVAALSRRRPFSLAKVNEEFKSVNRTIILRLYKDILRSLEQVEKSRLVLEADKHFVRDAFKLGKEEKWVANVEELVRIAYQNLKKLRAGVKPKPVERGKA
ncbi:hypothetical protein Gasu2_07040 [Galdieria sulphuraria]|uniref:LYR motif containing domain-containing protein n=1 Tax=Galdieria sulphuraria TaxID=130081 RepID=M2W301_GALSU|nr:uncharacterized protein Gasu_26540 [Galdieria sulphuraria]EME30071.1 hypothetical protein Gasu_26540 [Galdieria sulphuraria]GJD06278.1 hypothetical protein Gasu2_07040 [Galdieria sulphuraria]|eukprot:XP_005706591.1 hypothetical protein Gasu_26540 [Galdieria sulphuraria]